MAILSYLIVLAMAIVAPLFGVARYNGLFALRKHLREMRNELFHPGPNPARIPSLKEAYNHSVRRYHKRCRTFPDSLIASMAGFRAEEFEEIDS